MKTEVIKLNFTSQVHFGKKRLTDGEMSIAADTLFSALFIEALQLSLHTEFLLNDIVLSDTFPYKGDTYYLPRPLLDLHTDKLNELDEEIDYKQFKKLIYIPYESYEDYINGHVSSKKAEEMNEKLSFGEKGVHTKAMIESYGIEKETDDAEPYTVGTFSFFENSGLYFIVKGSDQSLETLKMVLDSLQYSGIGGKRSTGYGRFTYEVVEDEPLLRFFQSNGRYNILLSTAMATDTEIDTLDLSGADRFDLVKRSGFIQSTSYADTLQKKRDFYSFCSGSVFSRQFSGDIYDVSDGGHHPVYRYAKALWLEV